MLALRRTLKVAVDTKKHQWMAFFPVEPHHSLFPVLMNSHGEPTKGFGEGQLLAAGDRVPLGMVNVRVHDEVQLLLGHLRQVDGDDGVERRRLGQVALGRVPIVASLGDKEISLVVTTRT